MAKKEKVKAPKMPKAAKAPKAPKAKKGKKGAAAASIPAAGMSSTGTPSVPLANMSPEQMTAAQLEQAIKESNDPASRLKKLHSPINVRSCLLNILILIVMTLCIVMLWSFLAVDKFNFVTVAKDMFDKFGLTEFFTNIGTTISGWFS